MTLVTKTGVLMPNLQYVASGTQVMRLYQDTNKHLSGRQRRKARKAARVK